MSNALHDKIFAFCEAFRLSHPDFIYWLRERNAKNRLENGLWFQGNDSYVFLGLYNKGGGTNMTRSIGLVFWLNNDKIHCQLENVFNEEKDTAILSFYEQMRNLVGGFEMITKTKFKKILSPNDGVAAAIIFLEKIKPSIDELVRINNLPDLLINPENFLKKLQRVLQYQPKFKTDDIKYIIVNLSWNSNDWQGISNDKSGHKWVNVNDGNIPHESWNFDFSNVRNTSETVFGFSRFTNAPRVDGNNNLILFSSQNQIVGFYGNAEILQAEIEINAQERYNIKGARPLCVLLKNKITQLKEKGYLESLQRIGQVGFSYLKDKANINNILNAALQLNPEETFKLCALKNWLNMENIIFKDIEIEYPAAFGTHGQLQKNFTRELNIPPNIKKVLVRYNEVDYTDLTIGQEGSGSGRIYFPNNAASFIANNPGLSGGQKIIITVGWMSTTENQENRDEKETVALNQILFGPPGTGKTYHTITEAIKIVDYDFYCKHADDHEMLQIRFNDLLIKEWKTPEGQISFCTFHQSFSYEDFVEGIKPLAPLAGDQYLKYDVEKGIFQNICRLADVSNNAQQISKENPVSLSDDEFNKAQFYKVSLGDTTKEYSKEIYEYCTKNNLISVGFAEGIDFTNEKEQGVNRLITEHGLDNYSAQAINCFKNYLQVGNYVIISNGNFYIKAIGIVTGEYFFEAESEIEWNHFRPVEWIFKDVEIPASEFYRKNLSQQTIYKLKNESLVREFFVRNAAPKEAKAAQKNFVLIIDEINRGNVSSIFGEVITLIEPTKRSGRKEALEVVLPYSKQPFSVPSNVYIIGTMNTADRSIESLDTALRRRFSFKEMLPNPDLIAVNGASRGEIEGIDLVHVLRKINLRIEKLIDKDHTIGHSYFLEATTVSELALVFKDKVIPLLEEYFFGDFGKIGLVLGSSFITKIETEHVDFADFGEYDAQTSQDLLQRSIYRITSQQNWDYKSIYEKKPKF
jgi:hypothetical protein